MNPYSGGTQLFDYCLTQDTQTKITLEDPNGAGGPFCLSVALSALSEIYGATCTSSTGFCAVCEMGKIQFRFALSRLQVEVL